MACPKGYTLFTFFFFKGNRLVGVSRESISVIFLSQGPLACQWFDLLLLISGLSTDLPPVLTNWRAHSSSNSCLHPQTIYLNPLLLQPLSQLNKNFIKSQFKYVDLPKSYSVSSSITSMIPIPEFYSHITLLYWLCSIHNPI